MHFSKKQLWNILGEETINICLRVLNGLKNLQEFNKILIVLILKAKEPKDMANYYPNSLRYVIYQIIITLSKVDENVK